MLVIMRTASEEGAERSSFTVGDIKVTLLRAYFRDVKLEIKYLNSLSRICHVPYGQSVKAAEDVKILVRRNGAQQYGRSHVRIGIDAPRSMAIHRDDMKQMKVAA